MRKPEDFHSHIALLPLLPFLFTLTLLILLFPSFFYGVLTFDTSNMSHNNQSSDTLPIRQNEEEGSDGRMEDRNNLHRGTGNENPQLAVANNTHHHVLDYKDQTRTVEAENASYISYQHQLRTVAEDPPSTSGLIVRADAVPIVEVRPGYGDVVEEREPREAIERNVPFESRANYAPRVSGRPPIAVDSGFLEATALPMLMEPQSNTPPSSSNLPVCVREDPERGQRPPGPVDDTGTFQPSRRQRHSDGIFTIMHGLIAICIVAILVAGAVSVAVVIVKNNDDEDGPAPVVQVPTFTDPISSPHPTSSPTRSTMNTDTPPPPTPTNPPVLSIFPTQTVSTKQPTDIPASAPTKLPTDRPTDQPTFLPTAVPTQVPPLSPTPRPTFSETRSPTVSMTQSPTLPYVPIGITNWTQLGPTLEGRSPGDEFGYSIAMSADGYTLVTGARYRDINAMEDAGQVEAFRYSPNLNLWTKLGQDLSGQEAGDRFGRSVAISGDGSILAAGAPRHDNWTGTVRIFQYDETDKWWNKLGQDLDGENDEDWSGQSVALSYSGTIVAIGAHRNDGYDGNYDASGQVRVYEFSNGRWKQKGQDIDGEFASDRFGWSVAISDDGSIVAAGARYNSQRGTRTGHVRVYEFNHDTNLWEQLGDDMDGVAGGDEFGISVALSADGFTVAGGAFRYDDNDNKDAGKVQVFKFNQTDNQWTKKGDKLIGDATDQRFGFSVSLSGDGNILASASANGGYMRVFEYDRSSDAWNQVGGDLVGASLGDEFGYSVGLSRLGTIVAASAPSNDEKGGVNSGHVRVFKGE